MTFIFVVIVVGLALFWTGAFDADPDKDVRDGTTTTLIPEVQADATITYCVGWITGFLDAVGRSPEIEVLVGPIPAEWGDEQMQACIDSDPLPQSDPGLFGLLGQLRER